MPLSPSCPSPQALLNIISNPVNSTVPIAAETLKKMGVYDKNRLLGVTNLDVVGAGRSLRAAGEVFPSARAVGVFLWG